MSLKLSLSDKNGIERQVEVTPEILAAARNRLTADLSEILGFDVEFSPSLFTALKESIKSQWSTLPINEILAYLKALNMTLADVMKLRK